MQEGNETTDTVNENEFTKRKSANRRSSKHTLTTRGSKKPFDMGNLSSSFRSIPAVELDPATRKQLLHTAQQKGELHFTKLTVRKLLQELNTNNETGLSSNVAATILEQIGKNELEVEPPDPLWRIFLAQFQDLLVVLLMIACIVAISLKEYAAGICIIVIVTANAILGTKMEHSAGEAMRDLLNSAPPLVQVIRDSIIKDVPSQTLVPGDIVLVQTGKVVPADIRLITATKLASTEAALTGEAMPVKKEFEAQRESIDEDNGEEKKDDEKELTQKNMVYMGCEICSGSGTGVVVYTGMDTHMGLVARLLSNTDSDSSPLEAKLQKLGVQLGFASMFISAVVFIVGLALGRGGDPSSSQPLVLQLLLVSVSLTVAAVPEGLPACVTISLATGMRIMARNNAIIKKMKSVETLGSATVVCTDKTGTLTTGVMTVKRMWTPTGSEVLQVTGEGYSPEGSFLPVDVEISAENKGEGAKEKSGAFVTTLVNAVLCCDDKTIIRKMEGTWECIGNMSERPLIVAAAKCDIKRENLNRQFSTISVNPFDSHRKMMSTVVHVEECPNAIAYFGDDAEFIICVKGAPDRLLSKCNKMMVTNESDGTIEEKEITPDYRKQIEDQINKFSDQAFRVLAVAYRKADDRVMSASQEEVEQDLVLSGLFASIDPAREGVGEAIETAAKAGVRTIMITGDYVKTARAIAMNINLLAKDASIEKSLDCKCLREPGDEEQRLIELNKERGKDKKKITAGGKNQYLNKEEKEQMQKAQDSIDAITEGTDVFARAKPIDKITIIRSLLRQGHIASMTGDGVNDAPALKQASIGVAMGITGTDVAKGAADMILADDNFCTIIKAIEEGRTIYNNIGKFCYFLLSTNIAEVLVVLIVILLGYPAPLIPTQILWLNLTTDGLPAIALAVEAAEPGVMTQGPKPASEPLIEKVMITGIVIQTIVLTLLVLGSYMGIWYWHSGSLNPNIADPALLKETSKKATTMAIIVIVFAELLRAYTSRSMRRSVFTVGLFSNWGMQLSVFTAMAATLVVALVPGVDDIFGCTSLTGKQWGFAIGVSFIPCIVDELTKCVYRWTGFGLRPNAVYAGIKK